MRIHPVCILALLIFLTFSKTAPAQNPDILYKFVCKVSSQEEPIEDAEIRVFDKNEVLSTQYTDKKGKFEVLLMQGGEYTVEITKTGYYVKRMLFITKVDPGVKKLSPLFLDAELISLEVYRELEESSPESTSILDFPSVIIEYDSELGDFNYREDYVRHITEEIKKIGTN